MPNRQKKYINILTSKENYKTNAAIWYIPDAVCTVFELLMMGGETA